MKRALAAGLWLMVAAVVCAAAWLFVIRDPAPPSEGLAPAATPVAGEGGRIAAGPSRAVFSPDGTRLAVLNAGRVDLAVEGELVPVTPRGGHVVDTAWFANGRTLLVAEGPVPTGTLAIVDVDGTVRGSVPLQRPVSFGSGHGMAVAPDGKHAVLTAVERPPLGSESRHLVEVDLEDGSVRDVTEPGGRDEFEPAFRDDGRLVHSIPEHRVLGVIRGSEVVSVARGRLVTREGRVLADLPDGSTAVDVDATGARAVVVEARPGGQPRLRTIRLRARAPR